MKTFLKSACYCVLFLLLIPAAYITYETLFPHADLAAIPPLKPGDLIFQTALSPVATPIMLASGSIYTHVGMVDIEPTGVYVIQTGRTVIKTSLERFIHSGWGYRFTVERYVGMSDAEREALVERAKSYFGMPYNYEYYLADKKTVYCSELPYLILTRAGFHLDPLQSIGELYVNNRPVHALFDERWRDHPACQTKGMTAETCWQAVMKEPIITPAHLARDGHMATVYSNYLF